MVVSFSISPKTRMLVVGTNVDCVIPETLKQKRKTIAKKFYPLVYEKFGNKLKFEKKTISANLPEIGKVKMMMSGYYDLAAMTFHSNGEMKTRNPVHVVFMDAVSQCQ